MKTILSLRGLSRRHRLSRPSPDTQIGHVYDLFMTGQYIKRPSTMTQRYWRSCKDQLRDFWGLEYESIPNKGIRCTGKWEGPYFVPLERIQ